MLLLRSISRADGITKIRLLNDRELTIPHGHHRLTKAQWRQLAVDLHQQLVKVSPAYCPEKVSMYELKNMHLDKVFYLGRPEDDEALLRIAIVSATGELLTLDGCSAGDKYTLEYRDDLGFRAISNKE